MKEVFQKSFEFFFVKLCKKETTCAIVILNFETRIKRGYGIPNKKQSSIEKQNGEQRKINILKET